MSNILLHKRALYRYFFQIKKKLCLTLFDIKCFCVVYYKKITGGFFLCFIPF